HSTLAPDCFTTSAHLSTSPCTNCANSGVALGAFGLTTPRWSNTLRTASLANALLTATFICCTMAGSVAAGANRPNHDCTEKSGMQDSASVGISGAEGDRSDVVTPRARSLPACALGSTVGILSKIESTCPPSRSVMAGPLPRYGTCRILVPVCSLNNSHDI